MFVKATLESAGHHFGITIINKIKNMTTNQQACRNTDKATSL